MVYYKISPIPWAGISTLLIALMIPLVIKLVHRLVLRYNGVPGPNACRRERAGFFRILVIFAGMLCLITAAAGVHQIIEHNDACRRFKDGQYSVVEGEVRNLVSGGNNGRKSESFEIAGVRFAYQNNDEERPGYHTTKPCGGVIRYEGQRLRIGCIRHERYGNLILLIEKSTSSRREHHAHDFQIHRARGAGARPLAGR